MGEWQSISTAPKDGSRVLLWYPDHESFVTGEKGAMIAARWHVTDARFGGRWVVYAELRRKWWRPRTDFWRIVAFANPTMWHALPEHPAL